MAGSGRLRQPISEGQRERQERAVVVQPALCAGERVVRVKLFKPDTEPEPAAPPKIPIVRERHPRCACGCGKAAYWPQGRGQAVFHTRLCGYLMALKIVMRQWHKKERRKAR